MYYLNSRYYNPEIGRFINADGLLGEQGDILGHNLYAYCQNNPVMMVDPDGEFAISLLAGLAISFVIGSGSSIISQGLQYGWENVNYLQAGIDGLFALGGTALAATGIGLGASIALGAGMGFAQYGIDSAFHGEKLTWSGALISTGFGALGGYISGRGAQHFKSIGSNLDEQGRTGVKAILTAYDKYGDSINYQKTLNLWGSRVSSSISTSISKNFTKSTMKIFGYTVFSYYSSYKINQIY